MFGRKAAPKTQATAQTAMYSFQPPVPQGPMRGYEAGWAPMPGAQHPSQQIGVFAGQMLSQYPAMLPGAQLFQGREAGNSQWYYPALTVIPNGNLQQTQANAVVAGGQRYGSIYSGPIGPISARAAQAAVTAAQVRQSGLSAMSWAKDLTPQ